MAQLLVLLCYGHQVLLLHAAALLLPGDLLLSAQYKTREITQKSPVSLMMFRYPAKNKPRVIQSSPHARPEVL